MTQIDNLRDLNRRGVLKGAGALVVIGRRAGVELRAAGTAAAAAPSRRSRPTSSIPIIASTPTAASPPISARSTCGQGTDVGIGQIVAEELDRADRARQRGAWATPPTTVNQGGASGSTGIWKGGAPLRNAAAEARRVLVEMAAEKLGVAGRTARPSPTAWSRRPSDPAKKVSYGELIGGRYFDAPLEWNRQDRQRSRRQGQGQAEDARANTRSSASRIRARDVAAKVFGKLDYVTDIKVPGMLHGRMIRPPVAGAVPVAVDESSVKDIPGVRRSCSKKGFIGVVAPKEWDAIRAARAAQGHLVAERAALPDQSAALRPHPQGAGAQAQGPRRDRRRSMPPSPGRAKVVEAEYEWPFQSHASMGPACAVADDAGRRGDRVDRLAEAALRARRRRRVLGLPPEKVHAIWVTGPRLLWPQRRRRRRDGCRRAVEGGRQAGARARHALRRARLGPEGPGLGPSRARRARRGRQGRSPMHFESKGFSRIDIDTNESRSERTAWPASCMGLPLKPGDAFGVPDESYGFANKRLAGRPSRRCSTAPRRCAPSHLRDPVGPQIHFASESFIDEIAARDRQPIRSSSACAI